MEEKLTSFKDLRVWKEGYALTLRVYKITAQFPKNELYGIVSQMRRACVSMVSNIAEGYSRKGRKEYVQFLWVAYGSLSELETQILLSKDLNYIKEQEFKELIELKNKTGGMLYRLIQKLGTVP